MKAKGLLLSATLALAAVVSLPANDDLRQQISHTYALAADGCVSLENINGNVHILAWDRNEVKVEAVKTASSRGLLEGARVLVNASPGSISIRASYAGETSSTDPGKVEFTVTVPRHSRLDQIKLINGELDIQGVTGAVNASSVNGTVRAQGIAGDARLSTVNGKLEAAFDHLSGARNISLNAVNGNITLSIPYDARAEFDARNVTGGIDNDFGIPVNRGGTAGSRLHGVIKGGGTYINLTNINGSINIVPVAHGRRVRFT